MNYIFILVILFFISVVVALHRASVKSYAKEVSKRQRYVIMFYHWNWLLLIGGISTALFIGFLKWTGFMVIV